MFDSVALHIHPNAGCVTWTVPLVSPGPLPCQPRSNVGTNWTKAWDRACAKWGAPGSKHPRCSNRAQVVLPSEKVYETTAPLLTLCLDTGKQFAPILAGRSLMPVIFSSSWTVLQATQVSAPVAFVWAAFQGNHVSTCLLTIRREQTPDNACSSIGPSGLQHILSRQNCPLISLMPGHLKSLLTSPDPSASRARTFPQNNVIIV